MDRQARPRLTSLHIGNAHFSSAKEMNFCSKHGIGSSCALSFSCYQEVLSKFPTAKYQLLYWLEPVELNQGAELCFLTFLKFLKDKQVLSDRRLPLGSALLLKAPSAALWPPRMGPRYSLWYCLCSDLQPLVGQKGHEVTLFLPCFLGSRKLQTLSCSASSRQLYQHPVPYPHSCHF